MLFVIFSGLSHVDATVSALVEIINAFTLCDLDTANLATKLYVKFLMSPVSIYILLINYLKNCIDGVMIIVHISHAVDHGFETPFGPTKDYRIGTYCFCPKCIALRSKSKDWLARNQDVLEWIHMSTHGHISKS